MRGVDSFAKLWARRTTVELPDRSAFDLLSLPDLVQAKKTQRDKDWPKEREADRRYWKPLRRELEQLRHERRAKVP